MIETLDLDLCSPEKLGRILARIRCRVVEVRVSPGLNGYHVIVDCVCGACRLVFDDPTRFSKDLSRPPHMRNVLFTARRRKLYLLTRGRAAGGGSD